MQGSIIPLINWVRLLRSYLKELSILPYSKHKQFNQSLIYKSSSFRGSFLQVLNDYRQLFWDLEY